MQGNIKYSNDAFNAFTNSINKNPSFIVRENFGEFEKYSEASIIKLEQLADKVFSDGNIRAYFYKGSLLTMSLDGMVLMPSLSFLHVSQDVKEQLFDQLHEMMAECGKNV